MFLDPSQLSISHLRLLSQLDQLQSVGYLPGNPINFGRELETTLSAGYQALTAMGGRASQPPAVRFDDISGVEDRLRATLDQAIRFRPLVAPDFQPLQGLLTRGRKERLFPVIIEKATYEQARAVGDFPAARGYLDEFAFLNDVGDMDPLVFLLRDWSGRLHAMAIAALAPEAGALTMYCCRDVKFDRNIRTAFRGAGAILTLARLIYMKTNGHWMDEAPILKDFYPKVLASYRKRLSLPPSLPIPKGEWHIGRAEADYLIRSSPFELVHLPASRPS
ncbi:MAG TPA: hypothetical protein VFX30_14620 [bacterium]|nr:hypothetical protein [bacterium]